MAIKFQMIRWAHSAAPGSKDEHSSVLNIRITYNVEGDFLGVTTRDVDGIQVDVPMEGVDGNGMNALCHAAAESYVTTLTEMNNVAMEALPEDLVDT